MNEKKVNPGNVATGGAGDNQPEMFTKERVNELMRKRVERSHKSFYDRYGVKDLNELDALFGKAGSVDQLKANIEELTKNRDEVQGKLDELTNQHKEMVKKYAFTSRNIRPDKYSDIETYFKGKNLEINEDTLNEELKGHTDWINKVNNVVSVGQEHSGSGNQSDREMASKFLGVDL